MPALTTGVRSPDVDVKLQELVRGCASELPWRFDAAAAKKAAAAEDRALLVYVRCIDDDTQLAAAQQSLEMATVGWIDDGLRKDVLMRALPYWYDQIVPDLMAGRVTLIAAHGNSLRAIVKHLDKMSDEAVVSLNIPTGIPLIYELDDDLKPIEVGGRYLDPEAAAASIEAVKMQGKK